MRTSEYENKLKQQAETIERQAEHIGQLEAEIDGLKKLLVVYSDNGSIAKSSVTEVDRKTPNRP